MKRQIIDTIENYDTIIIHRHVRPDPDAYGSQVGLKKLIEANYPEKKVYASGIHDELLTYLTVQDDVDESDYAGALVIVTDTGNTERIDAVHYKEGAFLLKIDHHPDVDPYGDLRWVDTTASSTSEMIYELFKTGEETFGWHMPDEAARLLFAGIVGDTGRFIFPSATNRTFEVASQLITYDFDRTKLFADMYEVKRSILHLQGYMYQNFNIDENGTAYLKITKEILESFEVSVAESSQLVGSLGNVKGICAWAIFVEEEDQIRVRLRSKGPTINTLAAEYGGGGHPLAAGASVYSWQEADEVIGKLKELCTSN
ncbi:bifunctional oligoribonuclease/PAP phosphatase NrnA [Sporosarcina sp. Te-1]|uniref:DHH family phosphoesterase n=1 Tax=Sporosarcina sp. Te-1 TaxID=2818390 RepID=UPI001A9DBF6C|nr:bifunctional oligoribonuclease/PAP phosphatase NrnA [Sporosarcina sp. Te-1]QTD41430.1 bifunctional oligoribonuclease/PAP phosphatase NrnA [Sporosarcina sp. Te-1]